MRFLRQTILYLMILGSCAFAGEARFRVKPTAVKTGDRLKIAFAMSAPTDVEVSILNADGRVVRSLAAGVIGGKNPPPEPLKPGLAQELIWDGKGDWGLPVGDGPFKVRVRAGMGAKLGRLIGDSPYNFNETVCRGLAVDPRNGDLCILSKKTRDSALYFLRVYDRDGKYLREIMPYPATIDDRSREIFGSVQTGMQSPAPLSYHSLWPIFYPVNVGAEGVNDLAYKLVAVNPTDDTAVLMAESFASLYRVRKSDGAAVSGQFAEPLWERGTKLPHYEQVGPIMGAIAPDAKSMYFAGFCAAPPKGQKRDAAWPEGRVYRAALGGGTIRPKPFAHIDVPEDAPRPERGWNILADAQSVHGVTVDRNGRVFVCDGAGGKVWGFNADGSSAGSVSVPDAYIPVIDDKTGALYILTKHKVAHGVFRKTVVKLDGWGETAKVLDTLSFSERNSGASDPFLAGDFTGPTPRLWLSGCPREQSVLRIDDKDNKLTIVEDLADRDKTAAGFACRLDVDPEADLVYIHNGWAWIYRYNGLTGEYAGQLDKEGRPKPIIGSEFCIRRDGMIYLSGYDNAGGGYSGPWSRLNRDLTALPLVGKNQFSDRYGKMGGGYFGNQGSCVTPDGHLYFNGMFIFRINAIFEVNPDGTPGRGPRLRDAFANSAATEKKDEKISPTVVKAGFDGALVGWLQDQSGSVKVDQQGNIYAGVRILPRDYVLPDGIADAAKKYRHFADSLGSVVKFKPSGGGMVPDSLSPGEKYKIDKAWTYEFTVPEKLEDGIKMATGQRLDWYKPPRTIHMEGGLRAYAIFAPFSNQCACQTPRFDVDDYGRLYIPNAMTCSVQVVDNAGNVILTFGGYGNFDSQGPGSAIAKPAIPLAYPVAAKASFRHIYVADSANRRVVRIDPTWAVEELCEAK